jgi:hypothetical protein
MIEHLMRLFQRFFLLHRALYRLTMLPQYKFFSGIYSIFQAFRQIKLLLLSFNDFRVVHRGARIFLTDIATYCVALHNK